MFFNRNVSDENVRSYLISSGFYLLYTCYYRYDWYVRMLDNGIIAEIPAEIMCYSSFYDIIAPYTHFIIICRKMAVSRRSKCRRIMHRLKLMFKYSKSNYFLFLTFKFSDDALFSTNGLTRRRYVSRFLKSSSDFYVANIDFGELHGREHYHAIADCERVDLHFWDKYGNLDYQIVHRLDRDCSKLSKYINKITNHAVKSSSGSAIYSRNLKFYEDLEKSAESCNCDVNSVKWFDLFDDSDMPF